MDGSLKEVNPQKYKSIVTGKSGGKSRVKKCNPIKASYLAGFNTLTLNTIRNEDNLRD